MTHTDIPNKRIHQRRNIKRFREMLGIKQEALAFEQTETIEKQVLEQVAGILNVPAQAIESFDVEQAVNIITNTFNTYDQSNGMNVYPTFHFNPLDKMVELYERMLLQQQEMIEKLEKLIEGK